MIFGLAKLISNLTGFDLQRVQRVVVVSVVVLGILLVLILGLWLKSCFTKKPKIDLEQIEKINKANEKERKEELKKVIEENADTVQAVNENTAIAETNVENRDKAIAAKVNEADKEIQRAKEIGQNVTQEQLQCILVPKDCQ